MDKEPRWLNDRQAADQLGVSVSTLRNWRQAGTGPTWYKLGTAVRYKGEDLDAYLKDARREGTR